MTSTGSTDGWRAGGLPRPLERADMSRQARLLHLLGLEHSVRHGRGGLIEDAAADRLAARAGALPEELTEAGWWFVVPGGYRIRTVGSA